MRLPSLISTQVDILCMQKEGRYSDEASQKKLSDIMEGLTKQRDFAKSKMKDAFEAGIGQMQGYQEQVSNAKADVGNRQIRLDLTKTRLTDAIIFP